MISGRSIPVPKVRIRVGVGAGVGVGVWVGVRARARVRVWVGVRVWVSPRGMTQGAQTTFSGPVALLSSLAKLLLGGNDLVWHLETFPAR